MFPLDAAPTAQELRLLTWATVLLLATGGFLIVFAAVLPDMPLQTSAPLRRESEPPGTGYRRAGGLLFLSFGVGGASMRLAYYLSISGAWLLVGGPLVALGAAVAWHVFDYRNRFVVVGMAVLGVGIFLGAFGVGTP